jgi:hypothetical protein
MRRSILATLLAAGAALLGTHVGASAQQAQPYAGPILGAEEVPLAARPYGATYIPGVGFRYITPSSARVYGYQARAYRSTDDGAYWRGYRDNCWGYWWTGERCKLRRR